jgi:hypothetical protein
VSTSADPYSLLGVTAAATPSEVRLAFRKAALRYHPDVFPGEQAEAEGAFRRLVDAYHQVFREATERKGQQAPPLTPQELARMDLKPCQWDFESVWAARGLLGRAAPPGTRLRSVATLDEQAVFNAIWIGAMVLAVAMALLLMQPWATTIGSGSTTAMALAPLAIYVLILVAGVVGLYLTRKVIFLVLRLRQQRLLPGPVGLPKQRLWRLLTDRFR